MDMNSKEHQSQNNASNGRWTQYQHQQFIIGLKLYGRNWKKIQQILKTRTGSQIRSHAQKFFMKLGKSLDEKTNDGSNEEHPTFKQAKCNQLKLQQNPSFQNKSYFLEQIYKALSQKNDLSFWQAFIDRKLPRFPRQIKLQKQQSFTPYQVDYQETIKGNIPTKKIKI